MDDEKWQDDELCWPRSFSSRNYERFETYDPNAGVTRSSKAPIWRIIWSKIKKGKKKLFTSSNSSSMRFTYDPYSYSQNFDQGLVCADPDDLSRSFSARFAVSSRFLEKNTLMV